MCYTFWSLSVLGGEVPACWWIICLSFAQGICGERSGGWYQGVFQRDAGHAAAVQIWAAAVCRYPGQPPRYLHVPDLRGSPPTQTLRYAYTSSLLLSTLTAIIRQYDPETPTNILSSLLTNLQTFLKNECKMNVRCYIFHAHWHILCWKTSV